MHEASLYPENSFITLTYAPGHLPSDGSLDHSHYVGFHKRLVYHYGPVRFFMCGEYGETHGRPHYHAILFGFYPEDAVYYRKSPAGFPIYKSESLARIWGFGVAYVGRVTFESAAYVARYCLKVDNADCGGKFRTIIDPSTGFMPFYRRQEYGKRSLKPGIGAAWIDKYGSNVYGRDSVIAGGHASRPPRYYDKRFNLSDVGALFAVKRRRAEKVDEDWTYKRLAVEEVVIKRKLSLLHRDLE